MNHRPTRPNCDAHKDVGFQAECTECVAARTRQETAIAEHRERQAKVNAAINAPDRGIIWSRVALVAIGIIVALGSCVAAFGP